MMNDMAVHERMNGAGHVIRGTPWLTDVQVVLEEVGDRDFYKRATR